MLAKCEGIVIRTTDYGETNKIITLYTKEFGKVGVMARGAKKPSSRFSAVTQLFHFGHYLFLSGRGLGQLQQGETLESFRSIREDIFLTAYASYIAELLDKGTEERKPHEALFNLFYQSLHYLDEEYDPEIIVNIFEMKMLSVFGFAPELNRCVNCGAQDGSFSFSIREGGLLCHRCEEIDPYRMKISPAVARILRVLYYMDLDRLGTISIKDATKKEIRQVLDTYYDEYLGIELKTRRFLRQMGKMKDQL